jgi:multidrug efflux pump subunit AcrB
VPLFIISGIIGEIIVQIPLVVVCVLIASLVECFLILPGHLRHPLGKLTERESRFRRAFNRGFGRFRTGPFRAFVTACVSWRYAVMATAMMLLAVTVALIPTGRVNFLLFPSPESDKVLANFSFAPGTPRESAVDMLGELQRAARVAADKLSDGRGGLIKAQLGKVGQSASARQGEAISGDHLGSLDLELVPSDSRSIRTVDFIAAWRAEVRALAGLEQLTIKAVRGGPPGRDIDIRFSGASADALKLAALETRDLLQRFPAVSAIEDDLPYGRPELILELTPRGHALGFTTEAVGRQVRAAFEGVIVKRFARDDEEVLVRVQYPRGEIGLGTLLDLFLRGPSGAEVPLGEVVSIREDSGFARIRREDGQGQVAITADVNPAIEVPEKIRAKITADGLPEIAARHGLTFKLVGKAEEMAETLADMQLGATIGLCAIYIILAWVFASYTRPIVVMMIIPFGLIGAITGHYLLGFDLTILSLIGLLGLSGIIVNNSIILVSVIDERIADGETVHSAIIAGAQDRLRAVILTSLTTIGGLTPLMFETSLQAQFLIPMALTLVSGLAVASFLVLIVVPAFLAILEDILRLSKRIGRLLAGDPGWRQLPEIGPDPR